MSLAEQCDISYVVVSYNARDYLLRCLASIRRFRSAGVADEIIVVDNASTDGSAEAAQSFLAPHEGRVVRRASNGGFAVAANEGLAASRGGVIALVNPDAEFLTTFDRPVLDYLASHPDVGILGTQLLEENGDIQLSARAFPGYSTALFNRHSMLTRLLPGNRFSRRYLLSSWAHDETRDVDWVSGACMVLTRRGIESFGAFDPAYFMYIEDVDLCLRAKKAGFRVVYFPAVRVRHTIGGSSRSATFRMIRARHASMARYYRKHLRRGFVFDSLTVGGIWARCGLQFALAAVRRVAGRPHRP